MSSFLHQWVLGTFLWSVPFRKRAEHNGGAVPAFQSKTLPHANVSEFRCFKEKRGVKLLGTFFFPLGNFVYDTQSAQLLN